MSDANRPPPPRPGAGKETNKKLDSALKKATRGLRDVAKKVKLAGKAQKEAANDSGKADAFGAALLAVVTSAKKMSAAQKLIGANAK